MSRMADEVDAQVKAMHDAGAIHYATECAVPSLLAALEEARELLEAFALIWERSGMRGSTLADRANAFLVGHPEAEKTT